MKKQLLLLLICFFAVTTYAQRTVTGVVTSAEDGLPIIGASILVKGTTQGTITDLDGNYSINVPNDDAVLIFTYVGMDETQMKVGSQTVINVVMRGSALQMEEVVVTAMGIKAEKKKLNFAVQSLNSAELNVGQPTNFVDALQGRIAGVEVSGQGGSPNGSSQILVRGISSVNPGQDNEPIFILDGVQISGGASRAADLNPNDIESITVLKGAAAAALYGQDAANGAIMVTTKAAKAGALKVEASAVFKVENVVRTPDIQQMYVNGAHGVWIRQSSGGWGPMLLQGEKTYDNVDEYFQTGLYQKYDFSLSGGTEKFNVLASGNYSKHEGVIPNDYLDKWGVMAKANYNVNKRLSFSVMANLVNSEYRAADKDINYLGTTKETQLLSSVYGWPINDNIGYYKEANGDIRYRYDGDISINSPYSPLWTRKENDSKTETGRRIIQATMNLNIIKGLDFIGRIGYDVRDLETNTIIKRRLDSATDDPTLYASEIEAYGQYKYRDTFSRMTTGSAILTYDYDINRDFKLNALVGADFKDTYARDYTMYGYDFIVPGVYSLTNLNSYEYDYMSYSHTKKRNIGFYGELKLDYKGLAHVGATIRNDQSSTLSKGNRSYWYPSVSGGVVFSEIFQISNDTFSFGKLRGNWAKVGKDGLIYRLNNWFKQWTAFPDGGYGVNAARGANADLQPEMMTSWEIGADLRFFDNRTRLDVAYYNTKVDNQIVEVRVSPTSGYILQTLNDGAVRNEGLEITLDQNIIRTKDFSWDASLNIAYNRGKLLSIAGESKYAGSSDGYIGSDIKLVAYMGAGTMAVIGTDYRRTEDGQIICNEDGTPQIDASDKVIGNREPKATAGFNNRLKWKNWDLSFLINFRLGGDVVNGTSRVLLDRGQHKMLETYRNRKIVIDGVVEQADGTYAKNTTAVTFDQTFVTNYYNPISTNFIEDGSFIRLSNVTLGYDLSEYVKKWGVKGLRCSLSGNNLFLLTKYSGADPQTNMTGNTGGSGTMGADYLNTPSTRSFSLNISATF